MKQLSGLLVAVLLWGVSGICFAQYLGPNEVRPSDFPQVGKSIEESLNKEYVRFKWTWQEPDVRTVIHRATGSMYEYTTTATKIFSGSCEVIKHDDHKIVINKKCFKEMELQFLERFGQKNNEKKVLTQSLVNFLKIEKQDLTNVKSTVSDKHIIYHLG